MVVGLGVGALAILLGLTMREVVARRWLARPDQPVPARQLVRRLAIARACRAGGLVISLAGGAIAAVTLLALSLGVSDRTGAILVMAVISAALLGGVGWGTAYAHRYHPRPLPRTPSRRRPTAPPLTAMSGEWTHDEFNAPADGDHEPEDTSLGTPDRAATADPDADELTTGGVAPDLQPPTVNGIDAAASLIPDVSPEPTALGEPRPEPVAATAPRDRRDSDV